MGEYEYNLYLAGGRLAYRNMLQVEKTSNSFTWGIGNNYTPVLLKRTRRMSVLGS